MLSEGSYLCYFQAVSNIYFNIFSIDYSIFFYYQNWESLQKIKHETICCSSLIGKGNGFVVKGIFLGLFAILQISKIVNKIDFLALKMLLLIIIRNKLSKFKFSSLISF